MNTEERDVCSRGKSCKTACIKRNLVCREALNSNVQSSLSKLVNMLSAKLGMVAPKPKPADPASQMMDKGKNFLREYSKRLSDLDSYSGKMRAARNRLQKDLRDPKLEGKGRAATESELSKVLKELRKKEGEMASLMGEIRDKMMRTRMSEANINGILRNVDVLKAGDNEKKLKDQLKEFIKMFKGKGFGSVAGSPKDVSPLTSIFYNKERPWANSELGHMSLDGKKGSTFHEMAHLMENQRPWLSDYVTKWRDGRAWDKATVDEMMKGSPEPPPKPAFTRVTADNKNVPVYPIKEFTGIDAYNKKEVAVMDEFMSPYMGKVYENGYTEVLSMAVEHFANPRDMATLRRSHPEMFNLIVGLSVE